MSNSPATTLSSSEADTHLFTTVPSLLIALISNEKDFVDHGQDWAISSRNFISRDSLLSCLRDILASPARLNLSDPALLARLVLFLSWWIQYYPKDFGNIGGQGRRTVRSTWGRRVR